MKKITISLLAMAVGIFSFAQDDQNLVENGSFEQIEGKLRRAGSINVAVGWMSPTKTGADLFSGKVKGDLGTPSNFAGFEDPHDGRNYVGISVYSYNDKEPRQYISSRLKIPLRRDAMYCVKFYVVLAEGSKYASNNIGVNFSKKQYNIDEDKHILGTTHMMHQDNPVHNHKFGWEEICGTYVADGGEKYITIGNFFSDGETEQERMKKDREFMGAPIMAAYYFIDNISVKMIDDETECDCKIKEHDVKVDYIYEVAPVNPEGMSDALVVQYTEIYFGYGKSEFTVSDMDHLKNIEMVMTKNPDHQLTINAHMDAQEAEDEDLVGIDMDRAKSVKKHLVSKGISADNIAIKTLGANEPKSTTDDEIGHAMNRRVTFILTK